MNGFIDGSTSRRRRNTADDEPTCSAGQTSPASSCSCPAPTLSLLFSTSTTTICRTVREGRPLPLVLAHGRGTATLSRKTSNRNHGKVANSE